MLQRPQVVSYALITIAIGGSLFADDRPAKEQIREYITQAAAMRRADFVRIAGMYRMPDPDQFEDYSLTLLLFTHKFETQTDQFRLLANQSIEPSKLAREVNRGIGNYPLFIPTAPVSAIQQDRITNITCKVEGEKATGDVSFKVPGMYSGKVGYKAEMKDTHWHITDLMMSDLELHLVRGEGGLWKEKE